MDLFHAFADDSVHRRIDLRMNEAERRTDQVDRATVALEARVEELEAINAGLWALLKATLNLNDEDLLAAMRKEAEAAQAIETPPPCPSCGRNLLALNSPNCSWCGQPIERLPFKSSDVESL
ncbi:hypothetical protein EON79_22900 [bacterium]|nr:MAG: hypothetical protein EON79_22900 [bacterium]